MDYLSSRDPVKTFILRQYSSFEKELYGNACGIGLTPEKRTDLLIRVYGVRAATGGLIGLVLYSGIRSARFVSFNPLAWVQLSIEGLTVTVPRVLRGLFSPSTDTVNDTVATTLDLSKSLFKLMQVKDDEEEVSERIRAIPLTRESFNIIKESGYSKDTFLYYAVRDAKYALSDPQYRERLLGSKGGIFLMDYNGVDRTVQLIDEDQSMNELVSGVALKTMDTYELLQHTLSTGGSIKQTLFKAILGMGGLYVFLDHLADLIRISEQGDMWDYLRDKLKMFGKQINEYFDTHTPVTLSSAFKILRKIAKGIFEFVHKYFLGVAITAIGIDTVGIQNALNTLNTILGQASMDQLKNLGSNVVLFGKTMGVIVSLAQEIYKVVKSVYNVAMADVETWITKIIMMYMDTWYMERECTDLNKTLYNEYKSYQDLNSELYTEHTYNNRTDLIEMTNVFKYQTGKPVHVLEQTKLPTLVYG